MYFNSKILPLTFLLQSFAIANAVSGELVLEGATRKDGCGKARCALYGPVPSTILDTDGKIAAAFGITFDDDTKFAKIGLSTATEKDVLCQTCLGPPTGTVIGTGTDPNQDAYVRDDLNCKGIKAGATGSTGANVKGVEDQYVLENVPTYKLIPATFFSEDSSKNINGYDYYCVKTFQNYLDPCCLESSAPSNKPTTAAPTNKPTTGAPTAAPTAAPTNKPTTGAPTTPAPKKNPCFSDISTVDVKGKGKIAMKSLMVGDEVQTPSGYEKVYTIDHRSESKLTEFIQIYTDLEEPLEITGNHLVFVLGKNDPVEAKIIVPGDKLQGHVDGEFKSVEVVNISKISKHGLYNPITSSGTIIVNGVVTSTYTAVDVSNGSNYLTIGGYRVMSMHDFMHLALVPLKTACMLPFSATTNYICSVSEGSEHNIYNQIGLKLIDFGKSQTIYVQNTILLLLTGFFLAANMVSSPAILMALLLFRAVKKQYQK